MTLTSTIPTRTSVARRQRRSGVPGSTLIAAEVLVPILLLVVWWVTSANSTNTFFPPLQTILTRLIELAQVPAFWTDVTSSLGNLALSFALASVLGVLLGAALGLIQPLAWFVGPTLHFFRAIPPVALVPIFVSLIGFGNETRILSITLAALFPVLISTIDGIKGAEPTLEMVSRVYRFGPIDRLFSVTLPAASPRILSGMQVSLMTAFVVMIASEMLGSSKGLGAATLLAQQSFAIADMWAGILTLGVLGYAATALIVLFRRRVLRWYIASQQQEKRS
ncbi:ABC-type nitrate/sulfonate/bicarbonate transport system permease component [Leucobacter luti]|uniref:ABC transporter permease n=1 Tax=Leucobacter luti TaxID=340320 RepID=UPI00105029A2|nr:ABC transporter permease [Leucobacter luti]MCW2288261.1 ABC-type nitrate/sulfonate/bicarbonate transport system permease component [Leucobacter luti]TCK45581.1 ABC-type nitrate/sulfonate/bicarbonate transport system permease component [Leucobacter luti]